MFDAITDVLTGIWDFCTAVFSFVIDTVKGLADLALNLKNLPTFYETLFNNGLLPGVVSASFFSMITLMIILRILGRDG